MRGRGKDQVQLSTESPRGALCSSGGRTTRLRQSTATRMISGPMPSPGSSVTLKAVLAAAAAAAAEGEGHLRWVPPRRGATTTRGGAWDAQNDMVCVLKGAAGVAAGVT